METVVLPAQDHLAQERYRYQSRMMSGMIYPLGGLPRTRRKVKTPPQAFAASIQSENTRGSSNQSVPAVDTRNTPAGAAVQLDLTFGVLRGARFSSSSPTRRVSGLSTPQYRLHSTPSQGLTRGESARNEATSPVQAKPQHAVGTVSPSSLLNGSSTSPSPVVRTRSDGEFFSGFKKVGEVEKSSERKKSFEKSFDNSKNERTMADTTFERYEKLADKRKGFERKPIEKKFPVSKNQDDKPVIAPKKGIITILQRPQTKEAAAENFAKITGLSVESLQAKPNRAQSSPVDVGRKDDALSLVASTPKPEETEAFPKDVESGYSHAMKGRPGSPKGGKKRSVRGDNNRAPGVRTNVSHVEKAGRVSPGNNGHPVRVYGEKEEKSKAREERREASPASSHSSREGLGSSKASSQDLSREDHSSALITDFLSRKISVRNLTSTEAGHRSSEEYAVKQHGVVKSDSFRDIPRRSESCEVVFLPSSPPTAATERWAGPAYSNSPPPSTLPFPTFPTQRAKSSLNCVLPGGPVEPLVPEAIPAKSSSAPTSPTRVPTAFFSDYRAQARRVDPSSATKDLRRILNLDVECAADMEAEASFVAADVFGMASVLKAEEQQSATQSLKRILQLG